MLDVRVDKNPLVTQKRDSNVENLEAYLKNKVRNAYMHGLKVTRPCNRARTEQSRETSDTKIFRLE